MDYSLFHILNIFIISLYYFYWCILYDVSCPESLLGEKGWGLNLINKKNIGCWLLEMAGWEGSSRGRTVVFILCILASLGGIYQWPLSYVMHLPQEKNSFGLPSCTVCGVKSFLYRELKVKLLMSYHITEKGVWLWWTIIVCLLCFSTSFLLLQEVIREVRITAVLPVCRVWIPG